MVSTKVKVFVLLLLAGILSACASSVTLAPTSQPAEATATAVPPTPVTDPPLSTPTATDTSVSTAESSPTAGAATGVTVSFANDVLPILESRCVNCHGGDRTEEGLSVRTYSDLLAGSKNGAVVIPSDADHSKLVELILNGKMPKRGPKLTPPQVQLIVDWINQGAVDN